MFLAFLLLAVLVASLIILRLRGSAESPSRAEVWGEPRGDARAWAGVALFALVSSWPLFRHAGLLLRADAVLVADAASHAVVIQALAKDGAPHGWIDVYDGGFPFGVNYPVLGWIAGAALVQLGLAVPTAVMILGLLPYVILPVLVVGVARAAGARPLAALVGVASLAWIAPYNPWQGTYENFLGLGLLSQSMAVPILLGIAWLTVARRSAFGLPLLGAALAAAHPQLSVMGGLFALPLLVLPSNRIRYRLLLAVAGCGIMGLALYGPGLAHHHLPFAWTNLGDGSWVSGYKLDRLVRWTVDAELFDQLREVPIVTSVWLLAIAVLVASARHHVPRLALVMMGWSLALSLAGRALLELGEVGTWILSFLQPARAFAFVPLAMTATVVVAAGELLARGESLEGAGRLERHAPRLAAGALVTATVLLATIAPWHHVSRLAGHARILENRLAGRGDCGALVASRGWTTNLDRGRLSSIEDRTTIKGCPKALLLELHTPVPRGVSAGAGAHVGMLTLAFLAIDPDQPGADERAEDLGVRWVIHRADERPTSGFRLVDENPPFAFSERLGGTDLVGVGCVEEVWRGSNRALRLALMHDMMKGRVTLHPRRLIAIEETDASDELVKEAVADDGCDPAGATVVESPREPGAHESTIDAPHPVDVVIRATAFATWTIAVDGEPRPWRTIAPGFMAARVPAGRHHVVATAAWPDRYGVGLLAALAAVVALGATATRLLHRADRTPSRVVPSAR